MIDQCDGFVNAEIYGTANKGLLSGWVNGPEKSGDLWNRNATNILQIFE